MVAAGKLRHRANIRRPMVEPDESGAPKVAAFSFVANCWCEITTLAGRQAELAHQVHAEATHAVVIRHPRASFDVVSGDKILTDNRFPDMLVVWAGDREGRGIQLDILAVATTPGAA